MPLGPAQPLEVRTKSNYHPLYWVAATMRNTTSATRHACDIYEEIDNAAALTWTPFQFDRVNDLRLLFNASTGQGGADVFKGGHVVLQDNGSWYYHWASLLGANPGAGSERWSSHYDKSRKNNMFSRELQFEIYFPWNGIHMNWGVMLFGRYQQLQAGGGGTYWEVENRTWFQTEAHSSTRPGLQGTLDPVLHVGTGWIPYKLSGMNVGPRGFSSNTEAAPIVNPAPPLAPGATGNIASAAGFWPAMVDVAVPGVGHNRRTYNQCVVCGEQHGFFRSVLNHWHRCRRCDRIYCPDDGYALQYANQSWSAFLTDHTRQCANCVGSTELISNVPA